MKYWSKDEKGQYLVLLALLMPVLLGMVGLVIDLGMVYARRQQAQNAADAAALAGSATLCTNGSSAAQNHANDYVTRNHFPTGKATITFPTLNAGFGSYVKVAIADTYTPVFVSMVWGGTFPIKASATAGCSGSGGLGTVLILNKTAAQSFFMNGSAKINVNPGNIHVDSNHSQAVYINGANRLQSQSATSMVGSYFVNGSNTITPWPMVTGAPYKPDPLASVPEPSYDASGVGYTSRANPNYSGSGPFATLQPGIILSRF